MTNENYWKLSKRIQSIQIQLENLTDLFIAQYLFKDEKMVKKELKKMKRWREELRAQRIKNKNRKNLSLNILFQKQSPRL